MSEQTYEAELVYDAQVVSVDASISVKNDIQRAEIQIKKVSSLDKTPLASAKFNLVTLKEIKAFDGSILFEANDVITTLVTDSSGMAITDIAMPYGEYELIEVEAPKGYVIANATNKVVFEFDRTKEKDRVFDVEVENDPIQIKINKLDSVSLEQLAGAKLVIKDMDGNIVYGPFITGDSAELIYALPAGKYMLEEIEAPTGYLTASAEFTIENISDLQEFALIDQAVFGSITFEYDNTSDVITMPEIYEAPKTGDFMDMMKYLVLALISGICLLGAALKKKRAVIAGVMVMMAVMLPSKVMAETRTYTDEKVFASKTGEGYEDDSLFEKEVVIDGVKYKLDKIDYSVKEKIFTSDEVLTFTMEHTILSGEQYEFADTVERDGYSYVLKEVLDNERVVSGRKWFASQTVSNVDYVTVDNISEYCEVVKDDEVSGERIVAKIPYVETVVSNRRWQDDFRFNVVFTVNSNDGAAYFKLGNKLIPYKEDTPNLDGYEEYLLKTMGLDVECYKIHSIEWKSAAEVDGNGNLKRVAVATGERLVSDFEIKYSGEVALKDVVYHDLTANYEVVVQVPTGEKEYEVTAVATYLEVEEEPTVADDKAPDEKPEESNLVKTVLTSLTVFIVILLIVIVLAFVLRRKKVNRY